MIFPFWDHWKTTFYNFDDLQDQIVGAGALELLTPLLSSSNSDLINAVVRLLLNLSFDSGVRARMVKAGMLPRLVALLPDPGRIGPSARYRVSSLAGRKNHI